MTVAISPPVRMVALAGILAATGLAAFLFLMSRSAAEAEPVGSQASITERVAQPRSATPSPVEKVTPSPTVARATKSGFPLPVDRALRTHRVVVVVVYMPGAPVDSVVRAEARAGAARAGAGFVAVSALSERLVQPLLAKVGVLPAPAVLVVRRPGVVTATLSVADSGTVAQTALQAKR